MDQINFLRLEAKKHNTEKEANLISSKDKKNDEDEIDEGINDIHLDDEIKRIKLRFRKRLLELKFEKEEILLKKELETLKGPSVVENTVKKQEFQFFFDFFRIDQVLDDVLIEVAYGLFTNSIPLSEIKSITSSRHIL